MNLCSVDGDDDVSDLKACLQTRIYRFAVLRLDLLKTYHQNVFHVQLHAYRSASQHDHVAADPFIRHCLIAPRSRKNAAVLKDLRAADAQNNSPCGQKKENDKKQLKKCDENSAHSALSPLKILKQLRQLGFGVQSDALREKFLIGLRKQRQVDIRLRLRQHSAAVVLSVNYHISVFAGDQPNFSRAARRFRIFISVCRHIFSGALRFTRGRRCVFPILVFAVRPAG